MFSHFSICSRQFLFCHLIASNIGTDDCNVKSMFIDIVRLANFAKHLMPKQRTKPHRTICVCRITASIFFTIIRLIHITHTDTHKQTSSAVHRTVVELFSFFRIRLLCVSSKEQPAQYICQPTYRHGRNVYERCVKIDSIQNRYTHIRAIGLYQRLNGMDILRALIS